MIKQLFSKLAMGLFFGIGLGVAFGITFISMDSYQSRPASVLRDFQSQSKISIQSTEVRTGKFNTTFLGTLKNEGRESWRNLYIVVELFDASGKFIDRCSSVDGAIVLPGKEHHFKISCEGCSDNPQVQYSKYTIKVENGMLATM